MKSPSLRIAEQYVKQIGIIISVILMTGCGAAMQQASRPVYAPMPSQRVYAPAQPIYAPAPVYTRPAPRIYTPPVRQVIQPRIIQQRVIERPQVIKRVYDKTIYNNYGTPSKNRPQYDKERHERHEHDDDHSNYNNNHYQAAPPYNYGRNNTVTNYPKQTPQVTKKVVEVTTTPVTQQPSNDSYQSPKYDRR
jgi:hypothetical protein